MPAGFYANNCLIMRWATAYRGWGKAFSAEPGGFFITSPLKIMDQVVRHFRPVPRKQIRQGRQRFQELRPALCTSRGVGHLR